MEMRTRLELKVDCEDDVSIVRGKVRDLARAADFDPFATAAVTTAASELTRNVWIHAGSGQAIIEEVSQGQRQGLRVVFIDSGPGIEDIDRVLAGGYSTAKSLGLGVSGTRRLVDVFAIESTPGVGTRVSFVKWKPF